MVLVMTRHIFDCLSVEIMLQSQSMNLYLSVLSSATNKVEAEPGSSPL